MRDADVVVLAKDLLSECRRSKSLQKAFGTVAGSRIPPGAVRTSAKKLRISGALSEIEMAALGSGCLRELFSIVSFGMESGANVDEALGLFVRRLEGEIAMKNKLRIKVGSAQALTFLGMGVFFPLFSSISSVIFSSSLNLFGSEAGVSSGFALLSAAYVPTILLLSASFAHPEKSFPQNALSVVPYVAIAFCIMLFVPSILLHVL
jgi:hypothetical protein